MRLRRAFTFIELLTVVAALVIVFGLIISLCNFVRNTSATDLTVSLLRKMDEQLAQYVRRSGGQLPAVPDFTPHAGETDAQLNAAALKNNQAFVRLAATETNLAGTTFADLPASVFDPETGTIRDGWGNPIVYMPSMHPAIGMALDDKPFFFSAGPDHKFLTREDNLYSYESAFITENRAASQP